MDSQENKAKKLSMRANFRKNISRKRNHVSSSSDSSSSDSNIIKYKKSKNRVTSGFKKKIHCTKHKHGKRKNRSSSSDSSSSVDSSTSSTESSSLSSTSEEERKRRKKQKKNLKKKTVKKAFIPPKIEKNTNDVPSTDIPVKLMSEVRSMAPMTKEEWEQKQSIVRRIHDESTGRNRLIRGDGEVIEEIVSKDRHKQINQQATKGDGDYFQKKLKQL